MSRELFNLNADLKRLRDEGFFVQKVAGFLVMREVPYVDAQKRVRRGTLISTLDLAGNTTRKPETHVMNFDGEFPCNAEGTRINAIFHQSGDMNLGSGLTAKHSFSSKPEGGYANYYDKMTTYAGILCGPAELVQPGVTARLFREPEDNEESVFKYVETASDRAGIGALTALLSSERVAIIGVGGTGSYILDLVAKTPVVEIRLIDGDEFLQHNAFRAPGAPSLEELRDAPKKVDYLAGIYSRMRHGIVPHAVAIDATNLNLLDGITFAFLSMDAGENKRKVVEKLESIGASFTDVGMGLELVDGSLGGILRVTTSTPERREHFHNGQISYAGGGAANVYASNIQVADLNSLNATLAVIRWKRLRGFYRDLEHEHYCTYTTDGNHLLNEDPK
jgi:hypothetical protein